MLLNKDPFCAYEFYVVPASGIKMELVSRLTSLTCPACGVTRVAWVHRQNPINLWDRCEESAAAEKTFETWQSNIWLGSMITISHDPQK